MVVGPHRSKLLPSQRLLHQSPRLNLATLQKTCPDHWILQLPHFGHSVQTSRSRSIDLWKRSRGNRSLSGLKNCSEIRPWEMRNFIAIFTMTQVIWLRIVTCWKLNWNSWHQQDILINTLIPTWPARRNQVKQFDNLIPRACHPLGWSMLFTIRYAPQFRLCLTGSRYRRRPTWDNPSQ